MRLGVGQATALVLGGVLGPGVLALPAAATRAAGPAALVAWAVLLAVSVPVALSFAALGERYPGGGGVAGYVVHAFGPAAGAPVGWWFYACGVPVGVLGGALVGGSYVEALGVDARLVAVVLLVAAFGTNLAGLRVTGRVQLVLVGALVVVLAVVVVTALPRVGGFTPFAPHGWWAVGSAATVLFYAFSGWEAASHLSGEIGSPRRVTLSALVVVGVLYLGLAIVTVGVEGDAPVATLLERAFGSGVRPVTAAVAVALTFGAINTYIAGGVRLGVALARERALPAWFGRETRSLGVLGVLCVVAAAVLWSVPLDEVMRVTAVVLTAVTGAGMAAAVRLLPSGWLRRCAASALVLNAVVLAFNGLLLLVPVTLAVAALATRRVLTSGPAGSGVRGGRSSA
ncbi:hypothetical protein GCM10022243_20770 [Saccharothrix violaceirubra]|uniref:Amino acid efflux transporter n=1 Tax=Saccharothrix violaceirubra TaxID=413306 RepID=A0A7W7WZ25_9PSEU|nr:amino acid permease [Saccharothrix violaceirubra]MBB4968581.1 amino acid efflux transporter [Saccharothrix violaceirubra]